MDTVADIMDEIAEGQETAQEIADALVGFGQEMDEVHIRIRNNFVYC